MISDQAKQIIIDHQRRCGITTLDEATDDFILTAKAMKDDGR
jgi:hypothetical protein